MGGVKGGAPSPLQRMMSIFRGSRDQLPFYATGGEYPHKEPRMQRRSRYPVGSSSRRPVYGQDTGKFKVSTTNIYDFNCVTCAASLPYTDPNTSVTTTPAITTGLVTYKAMPRPSSTLYHDVMCRDPKKFYTLNTRVLRTTYDNTADTNSLRAMGVQYGWSEEPGDITDPYRRSFLSFKLDAEGFNCCDPLQFAQLAQMYGRVKQGPYSCTFHFTDPPLGDEAVKRLFPLSTVGSASGYTVATTEERTVGLWQYILVPPRKLASVFLPNLHTKANWDKLIDMGFKPRTCGKAVRIFCSNGGADGDHMDYVSRILAQEKGEENVTGDADKLVGGNFVRKAEMKGKFTKHGYVDTERACQFWPNELVSDAIVATTANRDKQFNSLLGQGYDCVPFGSAVVFCFKVFHGGNPENATRLSIPIEIHVDSFTKFSQPLLNQLDIDQSGKFPRLASSGD